jgi:hypothetical protein
MVNGCRTKDSHRECSWQVFAALLHLIMVGGEIVRTSYVDSVEQIRDKGSLT